MDCKRVVAYILVPSAVTIASVLFVLSREVTTEFDTPLHSEFALQGVDFTGIYADFDAYVEIFKYDIEKDDEEALAAFQHKLRTQLSFADWEIVQDDGDEWRLARKATESSLEARILFRSTKGSVFGAVADSISQEKNGKYIWKKLYDSANEPSDQVPDSGN